ncbi:MAG: 16S rRNA (cytosine(967)-C(5))-methyltransferase RsmB [Clostridia bacterium]|nr:16S rRNA (cytosine(967)-C(5))-methyltransferase RsmB [Clostridia bacterium]
MNNVRKLAFDSLKRCEKDGKYSNLEVSSLIVRSNLDPRDKGLFTALVYGVIEKRITLDALISEFSDKPIEKLDSDVVIALRLALYQLTFMDRIPPHAAINESVELVKATPHKASAPFVNAVLRSALKSKDRFDEILEKKGKSAIYSIPDWIIELWEKGYGGEKTERLLCGFLSSPPVTLRVNTLKITAEELLEKLQDKVIPHPAAPDILILQGGSVEELDGFHDGLFFVQGTSSYTAVRTLSPKGGERLIDVCACPGGKSFSAAIEMGNRGEVLSFDLHKNKLSLIDKGAKRLGIDIIKSDENNANIPKEELLATADKVICDVPCSGLGIIAKKPDIKYKDKKDIERLPEIQLSILKNSSRYLKKGGRLLYSTCTLNPDENERVTDAFLRENPHFKRVGEPTTIFPGTDFEDGFFYDILEKI